MKNILKIVIPTLLLFLATNLQAFVLVINPESNTTISEKEYISVEDFLKMTPETWAATTGKKTTWVQRTMLKMAQKRMKKKLSKGTIRLDDNSKENDDFFSTAAMFCGIAAVTLFVLGYFVGLPFIGVLFAVPAIISGIIGLVKEDEKKRAWIGLIGGALVILTLTTTIILVLPYI